MSAGAATPLPPEPGPLARAVRDLLDRGDGYPHARPPLEEAVLLLAAELDRRPGATQTVDPAAASRLGRA